MEWVKGEERGLERNLKEANGKFRMQSDFRPLLLS